MQNTQKMKKKSNSFYIRIISIVMTLICIGLIIINCIMNIETDLKDQIYQSLEDVTYQNANALKIEVRSKVNLLTGFADGIMDDEAEIKKNLYRMEGLKDLYKFKRMGYMRTDGSVYTSDDHVTNLKDTDIYTKVIKDGEMTITDSIIDTIDLEHGEQEWINVIAMPVYVDEDKIVRGGFFASYSTEVFREILSMASFEGMGTSLIVLQNGNIIAGDPERGLEETENLYEVMESYDEENIPDIEVLKKDLAEKKSGLITYRGKAGINYMYYMPVEIMKGQPVWYLTTVVSADVLNQRTDIISKNVFQLAVLLAASLLLCVVICYLTYWIQHQRLLNMAYVDSLTGEENYTWFRTKMRAKKRSGYIVSADLADFKIINNICGIEKGDELIQEIWKILKGMLRRDELAAHISGDSFVLFLQGTHLNVIVGRIEACKKEICRLSEKIQIPALVPKFGIYETDDSQHPEDGYGKANLAIKHIGRNWENCYAVYDEQFRKDLLTERWMRDQFESGIKNEEFQVWYQPKYSPIDNRLVGAEALVRWCDAEGKLLPPSGFVPVFEYNGMIQQLDEYMFRCVCKAQKCWKEKGYQTVPISVNISRASLFYQKTAERYMEIVKEYGIEYSDVPVEITETAVEENQNIEEILQGFYEAGFQVMIDDFGSGYSSLSILNMNYIKALKLDKKLIDGIGEKRAETLLQYVISMAHGMGLSVTAEGVEHKKQLEVLKRLSCDEIQGYYYSRPICGDEYEAMIYQGA